MQCKTISGVDSVGRKVMKDKNSFNTLKEAIVTCKNLNSRMDRTHKVVSYKCTGCSKYHIGRNGTVITDKYRDKLRKELGITKVRKPKKKVVVEPEFVKVGWIDLSKIKY
jgi:recombinational DNA repair protein RecR